MIVDSFASGSFSLCWCTVKQTSTATALQSSPTNSHTSSMALSSYISLCSNSIRFLSPSTFELSSAVDIQLCNLSTASLLIETSNTATGYLASGCNSSLRLLFLRLDFLRLDKQSAIARDWIHCSLRLLPADCDDITTDVIIADPAFSLLQRLLAQQLIFLQLLIMMTSLITSSSMVHLDVPAGSLLMFQLVHLPSLALAAGSYRSSSFTMLHLVQLGLRLITNN
ncbi:hypothetical protein F511_15710 [Dorcoceras hygrometricum]|uniref:Uncharacterized protein n=1 Tax=Dorcoceras hygrometricum TaxID=472368 RepID=A0A2Z7BDM2_9LAMI|nr:hypothetical protein F511_15710 [Dorcoceras hygrometricum]